MDLVGGDEIIILHAIEPSFILNELGHNVINVLCFLLHSAMPQKRLCAACGSPRMHEYPK